MVEQPRLPQAEKVIDQISLAIEENSSVAFVGPTGAGKTTLVDIILGLLPPQEGRLLVDRVPVDEHNLKNCSGQMSSSGQWPR